MAQTVDRALRAMATRRLVHAVGCSVVVDRRRFSMDSPGRPAVIRQVLAWTALDLASRPAIGGQFLRPLARDEDPG